MNSKQCRLGYQAAMNRRSKEPGTMNAEMTTTAAVINGRAVTSSMVQPGVASVQVIPADQVVPPKLAPTPSVAPVPDLSIMLNISGSASGARWTPENRGWNLDLFRHGNLSGWGFLGDRWLDPCLPKLRGQGRVIVHACQQPNARDEAYNFNAYRDGWCDQFGPFESLGFNNSLVYPGGIYNPPASKYQANKDMVRGLSCFDCGEFGENTLAIDKFGGSAENARDAGLNLAALEAHLHAEPVFFEPWCAGPDGHSTSLACAGIRSVVSGGLRLRPGPAGPGNRGPAPPRGRRRRPRPCCHPRRSG